MGNKNWWHREMLLEQSVAINTQWIKFYGSNSLARESNRFHVIAIMNTPSLILKQCLHPWTLASGGLESYNYRTWCEKMVFIGIISVHDVSLTRLTPPVKSEWGYEPYQVGLCLWAVCCLPLSVMKTFLLMAGVWKAKPILQFLMAAVQILRSPRCAVKPLLFLPPSKHAFNQLRDLVLRSSFRDVLMKTVKKPIPCVYRQGMTLRHIVKDVCKAIILTTYVSSHSLGIVWGGQTEMVLHSPDDRWGVCS